MLVPRAPNEQLQKHRRQIDAFFRQPIIDAPGVAVVTFRRNDPRSLELPQTFRQDVGGNAFAGVP